MVDNSCLMERGMNRKFSLCLSALLAFSVASYGQANKGSTTPPPNPSTGPESTSDVGKYANWDQLSKAARPGDYLRGTVTVDGGTLPWDPIAVTVTCDEKPRYDTRTDVKGVFLITFPIATGPAKPDAQRSKAAQYIGCQIQAAVSGFQSSTITIPNRDLTDKPDIGVITLRQEEGAQGGSMSGTSQSAPKDAVKNFEKARAEWLDQKPDRAQHRSREGRPDLSPIRRGVVSTGETAGESESRGGPQLVFQGGGCGPEVRFALRTSCDPGRGGKKVARASGLHDALVRDRAARYAASLVLQRTGQHQPEKQ